MKDEYNLEQKLQEKLKEKAEDIARKMIAMKRYSPEEISDITDLTPAEKIFLFKII